MREIDALISEIKNDQVHGASYLANMAMKTFEKAIQTSRAGNTKDFLQEMSGLACKLTECRPAMVPISNYTSRFIGELCANCQNAPELDLLRSLASSSVRDIMIDSERAREKTVEAGAGLIAEHDRVLTCSFSSTIIQTLACAYRRRKSFQVLAARSQASPQNLAYGERTAAALKEHGIDCLVLADEFIQANITGADKIIIGADSVLPDGSLWNGWPSAKVALAAYEEAIPFYAVCDSGKFCPRENSEPPEAGFDLVASRLITGIVCEKGLVKPDQIHKLIKKYPSPANLP